MRAESLFAPLRLAARLYLHHWPALVLLVLIGYVANYVLLEGAVRIGFFNHVLGLCSLGVLVLVKLLVVIAMFHALRPSLPLLGALTRAPTRAPLGERTGERFLDSAALALAPFFAYYAAWGFLGVSVREYSLHGLDLDPLGEHGMLLDALNAPGLLGIVAGAWLLRAAVKRIDAKMHQPLLKILITLCDAIWLFVGLFVISKWKDELVQWWDGRVAAHALRSAADGIALHVPTPLHDAFAQLIAGAAELGLYVLLPIVWLAMTALIYGRDVGKAAELTAADARLARAAERYRGLPALPHYVGEYFIKGYRTRFLPVVNCVRLTLGAGLPLLLLLCVGYRALTWGSLWLWIGVTHLIGPHSLPAWRVIGNALGVLLVSPLQIGASVLIEPLRIVLLAAILETALGAVRPSTADEATADATPRSVPAQA